MTTVTTKFQRTVVAQKRPTAPPYEEHTYVLTVQDDQSGNIIITGLTAAEAREVAAGLTDTPATNVVTGGQIPLSQLAELRKQLTDDAASAALTTMRHVLGDVDAVRRWEQKIEVAEEEARIYRKRLSEAEWRLIAETRARESLGTEARNAVEDLCEAIRLTREYVGPHVLPSEPGWAWWDALTEYAPEMAEKILAEEQSDESAARRLAQAAFGHDAWPLLTEDSRDTFRRLHHAGATIPEESNDE